MLANTLYALSIGFVGAFAIVALIGHVLLLTAIWPDLLRKRGSEKKVEVEPVATADSDALPPQLAA
jgi:hypothetical protein